MGGAWHSLGPFSITAVLPGGGPGTRGGHLQQTDGVVPEGELTAEPFLPLACARLGPDAAALPSPPVLQANILGLAAGQRCGPS